MSTPSPASKASEVSLTLIRRSLEEARAFYSPRARAEWSGTLYQYANRLAFHYLLRELNGIRSRLVLLDFCHASDVRAACEEEWRGATELIHTLLGLPSDLRRHGVFHAYVDVREVEASLAAQGFDSVSTLEPIASDTSGGDSGETIRAEPR
jgi:hypothetical protein